METDTDNQAHEWSADIFLVKEGDTWRNDRMVLNRQESAQIGEEILGRLHAGWSAAEFVVDDPASGG